MELIRRGKMKSSGAYAAFKACKGLFSCHITQVFQKHINSIAQKEVMCNVFCSIK